MTRLSIGLRLTLWYVAIFSVGQFAFGAGMWLVLQHHLVSLVDENLRHQTEDLQGFLMAQMKKADVHKFQEEVTEAYAPEHAGEYLAISTSTGDPVYISDFLKKNGFAASVSPGMGSTTAFVFEDRVLGKKHLRFLRSSVNTHDLIFLISMGAPRKRCGKLCVLSGTIFCYSLPWCS